MVLRGPQIFRCLVLAAVFWSHPVEATPLYFSAISAREDNDLFNPSGWMPGMRVPGPTDSAILVDGSIPGPLRGDWVVGQFVVRSSFFATYDLGGHRIEAISPFRYEDLLAGTSVPIEPGLVFGEAPSAGLTRGTLRNGEIVSRTAVIGLEGSQLARLTMADGARLRVSEELVVGAFLRCGFFGRRTCSRSSTAQLIVEAGSLVEAMRARIGWLAPNPAFETEGARSLLLVSGGEFRTVGPLHLGFGSSARITITSGGLVQLGSLSMGGAPHSNAEVSLFGGGILTVSGETTLESGSGTLAVFEGSASLGSVRMRPGGPFASAGLNVGGEATLLTLSGLLDLGAGTRLGVANHGRLETVETMISGTSSMPSRAQVSGQESLWIADGEIHIGDGEEDSQTFLIVSNGATVLADLLWLDAGSSMEGHNAQIDAPVIAEGSIRIGREQHDPPVGDKIGSLSFLQDLSLEPGGILNLTVAERADRPESDFVVVDGTATLAGTVSIEALDLDGDTRPFPFNLLPPPLEELSLRLGLPVDLLVAEEIVDAGVRFQVPPPWPSGRRIEVRIESRDDGTDVLLARLVPEANGTAAAFAALLTLASLHSRDFMLRTRRTLRMRRG